MIQILYKKFRFKFSVYFEDLVALSKYRISNFIRMLSAKSIKRFGSKENVAASHKMSLFLEAFVDM